MGKQPKKTPKMRVERETNPIGKCDDDTVHELLQMLEWWKAVKSTAILCYSYSRAACIQTRT